MKRLRVLVVDTSIVYRKMIDAALFSVEPRAVVHHAVALREAWDKLVTGNYQLVLIDTAFDGEEILQLVKWTCGQYPHVQLMLMGRTPRADRKLAAAAIDIGARAYMAKPLQEDYETNAQAIRQYFAELLATMDGPAPGAGTAPAGPRATPGRPASPTDGVCLVLIAASTGGPSAVEMLLTAIKDTSCPPILIVQHMPAAFTRGLAENLDRKCRITVKEAEEDELPRPGHAYIAPGGMHLLVKPGGHLSLAQTPNVNGVRPSADVLFSSVADVYRGGRILAAILTGMGKDGADGVRALKAQTACRCVVQDRESCVVYGMPREVVERGLADLEMTPRAIGELISGLRGEEREKMEK